MTKDMFDGFDHDQYKDEVEERWGQDAYARSDSWWKSKSEAERAAWQKQLATLNAGWQQACADGVLPESEIAQALAKRHVEWLCGIPGTPTSNAEELAGYVRGLGEMYVNDPRFAANYGGEAGAAFVRDALNAYLDRT